MGERELAGSGRNGVCSEKGGGSPTQRRQMRLSSTDHLKTFGNSMGTTHEAPLSILQETGVVDISGNRYTWSLFFETLTFQVVCQARSDPSSSRNAACRDRPHVGAVLKRLIDMVQDDPQDESHKIKWSLGQNAKEMEDGCSPGQCSPSPYPYIHNQVALRSRSDHRIWASRLAGCIALPSTFGSNCA